MSASTKILANTLASSSRAMLSMVLGLISSRWILQALGPVDFGLMGVVGSLIVLLVFFQGVLGTSVSRFYSISIGRGDPTETKSWFNIALSLHCLLPLFLLILGTPVGEWGVRHFLKIPVDRIETAVWVFRLSLISAFFTLVSTPFTGMFIAKQCIVETSLWSVLLSILNFAFAYFLTAYPGDAWFLYSMGTVLISVLIMLCQIARAFMKFPECRLSLSMWWSARKLRMLLSYAGWSLFGSLGQMLRGNGIAILLNAYFPPTLFRDVNASHAIASRIGSQAQSLSTALLSSFSPEITRTEGSGNRALMLEYSLRASKLGVMLVALFSVPLMLEINYILLIWLNNPPSFAAQLSFLTVLVFLIDKVTFGHLVAVSAAGKIAGYQLTVGVSMIATLPLAWIFLHVGGSPVMVGWACVMTMGACSAGRVLWGRRLVGLSVSRWLKEVLVPAIFSLAICFIAGVFVKAMFSTPGVGRCLSVFSASTASWGFCVWFIVLTHVERASVGKIITKYRGRFIHGKRS